MYVYMGPFRYRWVSSIHTKYMNKRYGLDWDDNHNWFERMLEKLEAKLQDTYNATINKLLDKRESQKVKIRIDAYDIWGMDNTLALIIEPMLRLLKEKKHGCPWVEDEDVPEHLRSTAVPPKENDWDIDSNHEARWNWVLDEMIWAFSQKNIPGGWEARYYATRREPSEKLGFEIVYSDTEGAKAHQQRISNGFRLFGKYFEALWD